MKLPAQSKLLAGLVLLALPAVGITATKDAAPPDREMLKMMEFLRQMEMLKQIDMMREMQHLEDSAPGPTPAKAPSKKPETSK